MFNSLAHSENQFFNKFQEKTSDQAMTINSLENTLLEINKEKKDSEVKLYKMKNALKGIQMRGANI